MLLITIENMESKQKMVPKIKIMKYFYIGDEYKNSIGKFPKFRLMNRDCHFTNFDIRQLGLIKILNKYLRRKKIFM